MPLRQHLNELRGSLIRCFVVLVVLFAAAFSFDEVLLDFVIGPWTSARAGAIAAGFPDPGSLTYIGPAEGMVFALRVAFLFGMLAGRISAKRAIFLSLAVYLVIAVLGYRMTSSRDFFVLALLVGTVQGGSQALSRSLFSTMIPKHKSSEFFAFFSVFEKFAGILGPIVFAFMISATGSSRHAILSVIAFFVLGGAVLAFVDVEEGQRAAREAERKTGRA